MTCLFALPVSPRDPSASITTVLNLVHLGKLIADASGVSTLGAHKCDEVQRAQVNLEELLQVVWFDRYLWTPRAITLLKIQPGERCMERGGGKLKNNSGWMFILELQQEREKRKGEEELGQDGKGKVRGK